MENFRPRVAKAALCLGLLLGQHVHQGDADAWITGRPSRSSMPAVAQLYGRDRPKRDWKALSKQAEERAREAKEAEDKAKEEAAQDASQLFENRAEGVEVAFNESDAELSDASSLGLEPGSPIQLARKLGSIGLIAGLSYVGVRKVVAFIKTHRGKGSELDKVVGVAVEEGDTEAEDSTGEEGEAEEMVAKAIEVNEEIVEEVGDKVSSAVDTIEEGFKTVSQVAEAAEEAVVEAAEDEDEVDIAVAAMKEAVREEKDSSTKSEESARGGFVDPVEDEIALEADVVIEESKIPGDGIEVEVHEEEFEEVFDEEVKGEDEEETEGEGDDETS